MALGVKGPRFEHPGWGLGPVLPQTEVLVSFHTLRVGCLCYRDLSKSRGEWGNEAGPPQVIV